MDGRLAMEGATVIPDGTEVSGRHSAENDGSVARTEGGGSMPRPALCKPRATAIITCRIYSHSWACLPNQHSAPPHCMICGHAYPTNTPPLACLPNLWACLPNQHSTTWYACLICGHAYRNWHACLIHGYAYPLVLHHLAYLPNLWACLLHYTAWLPNLWACIPNWPPALSHMACLPDLWACLPKWHSALWHACWICGYAYPSCPQA